MIVPVMAILNLVLTRQIYSEETNGAHAHYREPVPLIAVNVITTMSEQRSKTTRRKLCCEKLGTSHDVKSFATGSFLERLVVKIANDYLW